MHLTPPPTCRWLNVEEEKLLAGSKLRGGLRAAVPPEARLQVVDYLFVPRYRQPEGRQGSPPVPGAR